MADPRKTLADYHPQHDAFCDSSGCSVCGRWCCDGGHIRVPKPCTCGLDALLHPPSVTPEAREVLAHLEHAFAARLVGKLEHYAIKAAMTEFRAAVKECRALPPQPSAANKGAKPARLASRARYEHTLSAKELALFAAMDDEHKLAMAHAIRIAVIEAKAALLAEAAHQPQPSATWQPTAREELEQMVRILATGARDGTHWSDLVDLMSDHLADRLASLPPAPPPTGEAK